MNAPEPVKDTYTHGHHKSVLLSHTSRTAANSAAYLIPNLTSGLRVLDIGAGPGTITADFARLVSPGEVVGIDQSPEVISIANKLTDNLPNLSFEVGDVYALSFPDDSFDVVHAHQVLQHLSDPVAALREMTRVAKPGGIVAFRDADFHAMAWFPESAAMGRWMDVYQAVARRNRAEPDAGRHLINWAHAAGLRELTASSANWLYSTSEERTWLSTVWSERMEKSALAQQAVEYKLSTSEELAEIAEAWRAWAAEDDGYFLMPNTEIIARA